MRPSTSTRSCSRPQPHKRKPGYANFAIADPPLKLVLFEKADADARLNHLGVEVEDSDEVWTHQRRLTDEGVDSVEESGTCCFAKQDKVWVDGPDGAWEIYTVLEDSDTFGRSSLTGRRPGRATRSAAHRYRRPKPAAADDAPRTRTDDRSPPPRSGTPPTSPTAASGRSS